MIQVILLAVKNRKLKLPEDSEELHEIRTNEAIGRKLTHTSQLTYVESVFEI